VRYTNCVSRGCSCPLLKVPPASRGEPCRGWFPCVQVLPHCVRGTLKSAILTSPHPHPLKNKTPIGYPYPHDDKHQTSQDRTTRWAIPPHTPSRPPPTTPPHHTSQHHTTRTLPHPPTTHPRRTHHPRPQNHRPTRTHPAPLPYPQPLLLTLPTLLRPRWHHRPAHRHFHPQHPRDIPSCQRPVRTRTSQSPTLRDSRLAGRRPQRPLCAPFLTAHLLPQPPLCQPRLAPCRKRGLDCQPAACARVAPRGRACRATAAAGRGRRAGRYRSVGQAGLASHGLLRAHTPRLARGRPAQRHPIGSGASARGERPSVAAARQGASGAVVVEGVAALGVGGGVSLDGEGVWVGREAVLGVGRWGAWRGWG